MDNEEKTRAAAALKMAAAAECVSLLERSTKALGEAVEAGARPFPAM